MKKLIFALFLLFGTPIILTSCTADENEEYVTIAEDKDKEEDKDE
ncbi:hypothetical protein [Allomuricauda sp. CAU 1633]|nr:hypothetical protein [Muricauda sp. CAU 1633]